LTSKSGGELVRDARKKGNANRRGVFKPPQLAGTAFTGLRVLI